MAAKGRSACILTFLAVCVGFSPPRLSRLQRPALPPATRSSRISAETPFSNVVGGSPRVTKKKTIQQQQEELALVLSRMQQLEARIQTLEAEKSRGLFRRVGGAIGSHVASTSLMLTGKRTLPGVRLLRGLTSADAEANLSAAVDAVVESGAMIAAKAGGASSASETDRYLATMLTTSTTDKNVPSASVSSAMGRSATLAKASVDLGLLTAANVTSQVTSPFIRSAQGAGKLVDNMVLEYIPSTAMPSVAQSPAVAALLNAGVKQQLYDSRKVVLACISIGGVLGLIAGRITKSSLLYSAASSAFFGAYAATLSNQLGKTVRLVGVVAVALVSRLVEYVSESYRSATFVYQTGRWFERIDTSLQALDQNMGSPSKRWDAVTGFLASEVSANVGKAANGTIQSLSDGYGAVAAPVGSFLTNASTAVVEWTGGAAAGIDSTLKLSDGVRALGRVAERAGEGVSDLQSEWFEKEREDKEARALDEPWAPEGVFNVSAVEAAANAAGLQGAELWTYIQERSLKDQVSLQAEMESAAASAAAGLADSAAAALESAARQYGVAIRAKGGTGGDDLSPEGRFFTMLEAITSRADASSVFKALGGVPSSAGAGSSPGVAGMGEEELRAAFGRIDKDSSGSIDREELRRAITEQNGSLSVDQLNALMKFADTDGDGEIDYDEYKTIMSFSPGFSNAPAAKSPAEASNPAAA